MALVLGMMIANALANYVIFQARHLRMNFVITSLFPIADIALFVCLLFLDETAAWFLVPYLLYRVYSVWWCYAVWKLNERRE